MNFLKRFLILFPLVLSIQNLSSQTRDELILKGIDYVYKIQFDSASQIFQPMISQNLKDPTGYFFLSMVEWWKIYLNKEDESNDDNYLKRVDQCIKVCEERIDGNENDEWATFLLGGVIGYRGFLNSIRENWLKAVDDGKTGLSLIQRSYELNPSNKDAVFGIGLYNYAAEYVSDRYPFLKPLLFFFPKGNRELGLSQLKDCAENGKFSKIEANSVLCYVNLTFEKNYYEAEKYSSHLTKLYPDNPVFQKFLGKSYVGLNKWNESILLWINILSKIDNNRAGYNNKSLKRETSYYLALSYMKLNNLDPAIKYYQDAISISRELDKDSQSAYQVFSTLGLGMIYDLKGDRSTAIQYYDKVLEMKEIEQSHQTAKMFKDTPYK